MSNQSLTRNAICSIAFLFLAAASALGQRPTYTPASAVNTAGPTVDQVLAEINLARADPSAYAEHLVALRAAFKGNVMRQAGRPDLVTNEGVAVVDEAIAYLRKLRPMTPVKLAQGMCRSADDHALDVVNNQQMGHRGSDGSLPDQRLERYGRVTGNGAMAENIAYEAVSARDAVIGFIIDDGFPKRSHRLNIFSTEFTVIGVGVEFRAQAPATCVITFAEGFVEKTSASATPAARKF